jgi:formate C-acetyltransferase
MSRVDSIKNYLEKVPHLSVKEALCYTKSMQQSEGKPLIIRKAEALKNILDQMPILVRYDELIVGTFDEEIPVAILKPEGKGLRIVDELETLSTRKLNPLRVKEEDIGIMMDIIAPYWSQKTVDAYARQVVPEKIFDLFLKGDAYLLTELGGLSHAVIDYPRVLSMGLKKYIQRAEEKIQDLEDQMDSTPDLVEKVAFYKAVKIVAESIIVYAHKYAEEATRLAKQESDPSRRKELVKIAEVCEWVPENPARNLHEAVQSVWFVHLVLHLENIEHGISFGRIDQYLFPYYDRDVKEGRITREEALQLIECLFLKTNEIVGLFDQVATIFFGGMSTVQGATLGGMNKEGKDVTNEMTYIVLEAMKSVNKPSPNLAIRINKNTPNKLYEELSKVISSGLNIMALLNDEVVIEAFKKSGTTQDDARDYSLIGCVSLSTSGNGFNSTGAIFVNLAKPFDLMFKGEGPLAEEMGDMIQDPETFESMDDIIGAYRKYLGHIIKLGVIGSNALEYAHQKVKPTPLMSLCIQGCFEQGKDITLGPNKYRFSGVFGAGFADAINSLAALEHAVFREKKMTLKELITGLKKDFKRVRFKAMRQYLLNKCPKYGNDDELADKYARLVAELFAEEVDKYRNIRGGKFRTGIHAMTTHIGFGLFTSALPSGRGLGEPLAHDVAPMFGTSSEGLTAALKSVAKVDYSLLANGVSCTFNLDPILAKMEAPKGGSILASLIKTYFQLGGMHLQLNAISPDILKDAQIHPERHKELMVRVSGFSAKFIDLGEDLQKELIERCTYLT